MTYRSEEAKADPRAAQERIEDAARVVTEQARETARSLFEGRRRAAAAKLVGISAGLRESARTLERREDGRAVAPLVQRAADALDRMGATLEREDARSLFSQAEDFARRNPAAFFAGVAAAGFAVARFLRSSNLRRRLERFEDAQGGEDTSSSPDRARSGGEASSWRTI
jgi:hypothetical protein